MLGYTTEEIRREEAIAEREARRRARKLGMKDPGAISRLIERAKAKVRERLRRAEKRRRRKKLKKAIKEGKTTEVVKQLGLKATRAVKKVISSYIKSGAALHEVKEVAGEIKKREEEARKAQEAAQKQAEEEAKQKAIEEARRKLYAQISMESHSELEFLRGVSRAYIKVGEEKIPLMTEEQRKRLEELERQEQERKAREEEARRAQEEAELVAEAESMSPAGERMSRYQKRFIRAPAASQELMSRERAAVLEKARRAEASRLPIASVFEEKKIYTPAGEEEERVIEIKKRFSALPEGEPFLVYEPVRRPEPQKIQSVEKAEEQLLRAFQTGQAQRIEAMGGLPTPKPKSLERRVAEQAAIGGLLGGVFGGPVGAVVGGVSAAAGTVAGETARRTGVSEPVAFATEISVSLLTAGAASRAIQHALKVTTSKVYAKIASTEVGRGKATARFLAKAEQATYLDRTRIKLTERDVFYKGTVLAKKLGKAADKVDDIIYRVQGKLGKMRFTGEVKVSKNLRVARLTEYRVRDQSIYASRFMLPAREPVREIKTVERVVAKAKVGEVKRLTRTADDIITEVTKRERSISKYIAGSGRDIDAAVIRADMMHTRFMKETAPKVIKPLKRVVSRTGGTVSEATETMLRQAHQGADDAVRAAVAAVTKQTQRSAGAVGAVAGVLAAKSRMLTGAAGAEAAGKGINRETRAVTDAIKRDVVTVPSPITIPRPTKREVPRISFKVPDFTKEAEASTYRPELAKPRKRERPATKIRERVYEADVTKWMRQIRPEEFAPELPKPRKVTRARTQQAPAQKQRQREVTAHIPPVPAIKEKPVFKPVAVTVPATVVAEAEASRAVTPPAPKIVEPSAPVSKPATTAPKQRLGKPAPTRKEKEHKNIFDLLKEEQKAARKAARVIEHPWTPIEEILGFKANKNRRNAR